MVRFSLEGWEAYCLKPDGVTLRPARTVIQSQIKDLMAEENETWLLGHRHDLEKVAERGLQNNQDRELVTHAVRNWNGILQVEQLARADEQILHPSHWEELNQWVPALLTRMPRSSPSHLQELPKVDEPQAAA